MKSGDHDDHDEHEQQHDSEELITHWSLWIVGRTRLTWGYWQLWQVLSGSLCRVVCHREELCRKTSELTWDTQLCHSSGICPLMVEAGYERHRSTPPSDKHLLYSTVLDQWAVSTLESSILFSWVFWWSGWEVAEDTVLLHNNIHLLAWRTRELLTDQDLIMV